MKQINKVCLIEDDAIQVFINRQYVEMATKAEDIIVYENGKEAFEGLKNLLETGQSMPDLILLDLFMPVWDGWDFLNEYSKLPIDNAMSNIHILTSSLSSADREKAAAFGLKERFYSKPLDEAKLALMLSTST
jgi:CheY-like chemotaxis protein